MDNDNEIMEETDIDNVFIQIELPEKHFPNIEAVKKLVRRLLDTFPSIEIVDASCTQSMSTMCDDYTTAEIMIPIGNTYGFPLASLRDIISEASGGHFKMALFAPDDPGVYIELYPDTLDSLDPAS